MGKIRVKTLGEEEVSKKKRSYEERMAEKRAREVDENKSGDKPEISGEEAKAEQAKTAQVKKSKKKLSKRVSANVRLIDKNKSYPLSEAIKLLKSFKTGSFDESVELHINVEEKGISGTIDLPHGTGKERKIAIADENLIESIEKGKIDFDMLIASPSLMPRLAKVAKILGPRGLMPNPKNGTVTDNPKPLMEKLSKGQVSYKTEPKAPLIHMIVGKISFDESKLAQNIMTVLTDIGSAKIKKVTLTSTMSPGIKLTLN